MQPFSLLSEVSNWWRAALDAASGDVCVLLDYSDIGLGFQRRVMRLQRGVWVLGFPEGRR